MAVDALRCPTGSLGLRRDIPVIGQTLLGPCPAAADDACDLPPWSGDPVDSRRAAMLAAKGDAAR